MDFGSFLAGRLMAIIMDSHTKYLVVEHVKSIAFSKVKPVLEKVFAMLVCPEEVKIDNGPPFQGQEFREYLASLGISHQSYTTVASSQ